MTRASVHWASWIPQSARCRASTGLTLDGVMRKGTALVASRAFLQKKRGAAGLDGSPWRLDKIELPIVRLPVARGRPAPVHLAPALKREQTPTLQLMHGAHL